MRTIVEREKLKSPRSSIRILALFLTLVACLPGIAVGQGLKLDKATEKEVDNFDAPNPHFELECTECHNEKPGANATRETVQFKNGEKGNVDLCYGCHDSSDNAHPIHVDPTKGTPPVEVPKDYPLESRGEHKGTVVCSTCHFIHAKTAGMKLLRGFPVSSLPEDVKKGRFSDRREFCKSCHGAALAKKTPHKGKEGDKKVCAFCHATEPKEGEPAKFTKNIVELCDFCHNATKGAHYLLVNPFSDPNLKDQVAGANVPMQNGEYTCVSCHNPHGGTGEEKFLRKEFIAFALKSARVRPHFLKAFCEACHTVRPKLPKGAPGAQKLAEIPLRSEDPNALCNRCHESGLSKANAHPIREVPANILQRMPKDWPLKDGKLTCLTCHTAGDSPVFDPMNPAFLRGGPYETRNAICWTCHNQEEFAQLNPHEKIQNLEGCEYCHEARPDIEKFRAHQKQDVKIKGDIVLLCIRCHDTAPHPAGQDHLGAKSKESMLAKGVKISPDFPLDRAGRITCATCHNPHAGGESRSGLSGMDMCPSCHTK